MRSVPSQLTTFEPGSNWHLCFYRGWLIAILPTQEGFTFEYLAQDGESHGFDHHSYPTIASTLYQAKTAIKRRATIWLMDQWLCELQDLDKINFQEYCQLLRSIY